MKRPLCIFITFILLILWLISVVSCGVFNDIRFTPKIEGTVRAEVDSVLKSREALSSLTTTPNLQATVEEGIQETKEADNSMQSTIDAAIKATMEYTPIPSTNSQMALPINEKNIIFFDNFEKDKLDSEWIIKGNWELQMENDGNHIFCGKANKDISLSIGNNSWKDYSSSFRVNIKKSSQNGSVKIKNFITTTQDGLLEGAIIYISEIAIWIKGFFIGNDSGSDSRSWQGQYTICSIENSIELNKWMPIIIYNDVFFLSPFFHGYYDPTEKVSLKIEGDVILISLIGGSGKFGIEISPGWEVCLDDVIIATEIK